MILSQKLLPLMFVMIPVLPIRSIDHSGRVVSMQCCAEADYHKP